MIEQSQLKEMHFVLDLKLWNYLHLQICKYAKKTPVALMRRAGVPAHSWALNNRVESIIWKFMVVGSGIEWRWKSNYEWWWDLGR